MKFEEEFSRTFIMIRNKDESGVSGIGRVLSGTVFPDGTTVVRWERCGGSTAIYDSYERFEKIHIISHPDNETQIIWSEQEVEEYCLDKQRVKEDLRVVMNNAEKAHTQSTGLGRAAHRGALKVVEELEKRWGL